MSSTKTHLKYQLKEFQTAKELWRFLCPTQTDKLFSKPFRPIYRGQLDHDCKGNEQSLIPSVLRPDIRSKLRVAWKKIAMNADDVVASESLLLESFCKSCDENGARIPGDSAEFREKVLSFRNPERYSFGREPWPSPELDAVMAVAQHHGVPTRFLDWSKLPYVAAFFAASSAVSQKEYWDEIKHVVIWILNRDGLGLYQDKVRIAEVPGSSSPHLAAQAGVFSVALHDGTRGQLTEEPVGLESIFSIVPNTPLIKIILPVEESIRLLDLCVHSGFSAARLFPTLDGAGKATMDNLYAVALKNSLNDSSIKLQKGAL